MGKEKYALSEMQVRLQAFEVLVRSWSCQARKFGKAHRNPGSYIHPACACVRSIKPKVIPNLREKNWRPLTIFGYGTRITISFVDPIATLEGLVTVLGFSYERAIEVLLLFQDYCRLTKLTVHEGSIATQLSSRPRIFNTT